MKFISVIVAIFLSLNIFAQSPSVYGDQPLAHTFSIVAFDPETGDMGVAVQSHWFSVGTLVIWGEAGVGAIATQAFVNPEFGPDGLALLKQGRSAKEVVDELISNDEGKDFRQLGVVDANGNTMSYTGNRCIGEAGNYIGKGFAAQANMMLTNKVWSAMGDAFERSYGQPLAERLLAALEAAQQAGGDIRGQQSAALLVVGAHATGKPWIDRKVDLRVDDNPAPIAELKRLLMTHRAYEHMNKGDQAMEKGDVQSALSEYKAAQQMFPNNDEMRFWYGVNIANLGKTDEAIDVLGELFQRDSNWQELLKRLPKSGLLNVDDSTLEHLLSAASLITQGGRH